MRASRNHSHYFRSTAAATGRLPAWIALVFLAFRPGTTTTTEAFLPALSSLSARYWCYYASSHSPPVTSCSVRNSCGSTRIKLSDGSSSSNSHEKDQDPFHEADRQPQPTSEIVRRISSKLVRTAGVSRRVATSSRGGSSDDVVQSAAAAETAWWRTGGVSEMARRGGSDVRSAARRARSGLARRAGSATAGLQTALQQGQTSTVSVWQWLDRRARDGASATHARAKGVVLQFTGKSDYAFGDITRELVQRTTRSSSSTVSLQDLLLLLKIVLTAGASLTPLAKLLPLAVLLDLLNVSLEARIGGKLLEVLAGSLDDRFQAAFTAEELGDLAKRSLIAGIAAFTGKERYEAGDIERAVKEEEVAQQQQQHDGGGTTTVEASNSTGSTPTKNNNNTPAQQQQQQQPRQPTTKTLNLRLDPEFEAWDAAFRDSHPGDWEMAVESSLNNSNQINSKTLDMEIISELDEWDRKFERMDSR